MEGAAKLSVESDHLYGDGVGGVSNGRVFGLSRRRSGHSSGIRPAPSCSIVSISLATTCRTVRPSPRRPSVTTNGERNSMSKTPTEDPSFLLKPMISAPRVTPPHRGCTATTCSPRNYSSRQRLTPASAMTFPNGCCRTHRAPMGLPQYASAWPNACGHQSVMLW